MSLDNSQKEKRELWPIVAIRMPPECLRQLRSYAEKNVIGVSTAVRSVLLQAGVITAVDSSDPAESEGSEEGKA